jgi:hypothetical protein
MNSKRISLTKFSTLVIILVFASLFFVACSGDTTTEATTEAITTEAPTTMAPTTMAPTTVAPTTVAPTTVAPTTVAPTTEAPTTVAPTTVAPTTVAPTTEAPTTVAPTTEAPTTVAPTTEAPTTIAEVMVSSIVVTGTGGVAIIDVDNGTLQMLAEVLPANADDDSVVWTVENGTGTATINATGLFTAVSNGTVTVKATSVSTPSISETMVITISNQVVVAPTAVDLGSADAFIILGKTGISTTGTTLITGDIGVSPIGATAITGFGLTMDSSGEYSTSTLVIGNVYASDYTEPTPTNMTAVISDMLTAYSDAVSRAPDFTELYGGDLSGQTLVAGVYKYSTGVIINTALTLNGSETDVFIFQISGSLSEASAIQVTLTGGVLAENIFWQVAGNVTIGANAHFEGTILSATGIALGNGATVHGKLFSQTAVSLDGNAIE